MGLLRVLLFPHPSRDEGREGGMEESTGWASEHPEPAVIQPGLPIPWHRHGAWNRECGGWRTEDGVWNREYGAWRMEHGGWNREYGA